VPDNPAVFFFCVPWLVLPYILALRDTMDGDPYQNLPVNE